MAARDDYDDDAADVATILVRARQAAGLAQVELARRAGIAPSYLSRIEAGSWRKGGPWPSDQVLRSLARHLGVSSTELIRLRNEERTMGGGAPAHRRRGWSGPGYTVCTDGDGVYQAAKALIDRNPPRHPIRTTSVRMLEGEQDTPTLWQAEFVRTLTEKVSNDPESTLYRVCASSADNIALVRQTAVRIAGDRPPADVRNIRSRFCFGNPLVLDFIIGANEALIAIPDRRNRPSLRACVVVDDPDFVTAMQDWYDEFIWEPSCDWTELSYDTLESALDEVETRLRATEKVERPTPPG
ncbi:MAG TPA: helix-turn-helix transcriptional regulator [Acidimicrobiales bacterium]